ncbi:MAG: 1-acyl-sn-glycerol-3-phosphate acyltransferase, partial [Vibrio sp.]|nr:1-acyl-sn-glycerol-3-phosphate acyltransferase [Vibrio sp.]
SIEGYGKENLRELATLCREQMMAKLAQLDEEVAMLDGKKVTSRSQ